MCSLGKLSEESICQARDVYAERVLYIKIKQIEELYTLQGRRTGEPLLPKSSLEYYLESSKPYLGKKVVRFKDIIHGAVQYDTVTNLDGTIRSTTQKSHTELAYCFDYDLLVQYYDLNLIPADDEELEEAVEAVAQTETFDESGAPF